MITTHEKWAALPTADIHKYLDKYDNFSAPGKCSSRRKRKVRHLQNILDKRKKAERLLTQSF